MLKRREGSRAAGGRVWDWWGSCYWWTATVVTNQQWAHEETEKLAKFNANADILHG